MKQENTTTQHTLLLRRMATALHLQHANDKTWNRWNYKGVSYYDHSLFLFSPESSFRDMCKRIITATWVSWMGWNVV